MRNVANNATSMAARVRLSSVVAVAATATMYAGFAALGAQAVALVAALGPLTGLLALLPALAFATVAGVGALIFGFAGLASAMKHAGGTGGAAGQALAAAERRVELAQRSALDAQRALNDARDAAARRVRDLAHELAGAQLDERGAALAMRDALQRLRSARFTGDRSAIQREQLAYEQAALSLEEVRDRVGDLKKEKQTADTQGVEGSDQVQAALRRQADAVYELAQAQKALASSAGGGVDKAAQAYAKLAPAGRQLVDVLRSLGPAWRTVQQAIQQSTLAGVAADIKNLSQAYLPVMRAQLPAIAAGWNEAFRGTAAMATTKEAVTDTNAILAFTAILWQQVGKSFAPFLAGFRHFALVGSTFLPGIGDWVLRIGQRFERWAAAARESGRAQGWIQGGLTTLGQLWAVLRNLGSAIVSIFRAGSGGPGWLPGLVAGTAALSAWLASPVGQGKLAAIFTTLRTVGSQLWEVLKVVASTLLDLIPAAGATASDSLSVFKVVVGFAADHVDLLAKALPFLVAGFLVLKSAQVVATIASAAHIPVTIWQSVVMWRHTTALNANTAAILGNDVATKRSLAGMIAMKAAQIGGAIATGAATVANFLFAASTWAALLPILLVIAVIALLVLGFLYLWNHSEGFRKFFIGMWAGIWGFLKEIGHWFADDFAGFFVKAWHMIEAAFKWENFVAAFKTAVNWLIKAWNALDFGIHLHLPSWAGGYGFDVDDIIPDIPYLATGGRVTGSGMAFIHRGEEITPAAQVQALPPARTTRADVVILKSDGSPLSNWMVETLRKAVRDRGGDVQLVLGKS